MRFYVALPLSIPMTAIMTIAAIAGLVWGLIIAARGSLLLGCVLYLIAAACFGPYLLSFDVAGITLSLDRVFLVGLVGAAVLQRKLGQTDPKPLAGVDVAMIGLVGVLAISTFTHDYRDAGPADVPIVQHLLNGYCIPLAIYWIARQAKLDEREVTRVLIALTVFGVYLAVIGILEGLGQYGLVYPRYIANPELGLHFGRARGPMVHSVSYGIYLDTCLLACGLWMTKQSRGGKLALATLVPLFLLAIIFTKTRSVWMGAGTGILIVLAFKLQGRLRVALLASAVAAVVLVLAVKTDAFLGLQREGTVQDTRQSADMRKVFTYVSWKMFQDKPLWGVGFGQFAKAKLPYLTDHDTHLQLETIRQYVHHNTFLSILTETGLIGLGIFLAMLWGWTRAGWQLVRDRQSPAWMQRHGLLLLGMLGIAVWQMLFHEITFTTLDQSLLYFVVGIGVGLRQMLIHRPESNPVPYATSAWYRPAPLPAPR